MDNPPPPQYQHLHLPRNEVVVYATVRPNARLLARDIQNLGYDVWVHHVDTTGFQHPNPPQGVLLHSIAISRVIILFAARDEGSSSGETSVQSSVASYITFVDSDAVDSDTGHWGRLAYRRNADADEAPAPAAEPAPTRAAKPLVPPVHPIRWPSSFPSI